MAARDDGLAALESEATDPWRIALDAVAPGRVRGWGAYVAGVAWALRRQGRAVPNGFTAAVASCVPVGAGLSSSAALEAPVALGLGGPAADPADLLVACMEAENEIAGAATGGMDQAIALFGQPGNAMLLDFGGSLPRQVPFDLAAHGLAVLIMDTRVHHQLSDGQYGSRRDESAAAAAALGVESLSQVSAGQLDQALARLGDDLLRRRTRHIVTENQRVAAFAAALEAGDFGALGPLMDASHASMRDDYQISCAELDLAVETARLAGALGARMTGGGFGGSAIALVAADREEAVAHAVREAFAAAGWAEPAFLAATAGDGARREPGGGSGLLSSQDAGVMLSA
jgi:galactokinase